MYGISGYGSMIVDKVRMEAYSAALRRAVKPGHVVLDIGTGTGIFALLACQLGAQRVYAVEPADAIQVAREIAKTNGLADRIEFVQNLSTKVTLAERADVIISDMRGVLPWFQHHLPAIVDARERLLAARGVLIPQRDILWAAVVEAPELYRRHVRPWDENPIGLNMQPALRLVTNSWAKGKLKPEQLLSAPERWAEVDYATVQEYDIHALVSWTLARGGTGHGLAIWFDAVLAEGIGFSNGPGQPDIIYGQAFLPWTAPIVLAAGDQVSVTLSADLVGDDYIWRWDTRVLDQGRPEKAKADFRQSTFFGVPLSPGQLRKRAGGYLPELNEDGQIDCFILMLMDSRVSLEEIARQAAQRFPKRFPKWHDALTRAGELSLKYSR